MNQTKKTFRMVSGVCFSQRKIRVFLPLTQYIVYFSPSFSALHRIGCCCLALWCGLVYSGSVFGQSARHHYGTGITPLVIEKEGTGYATEMVVPLPGGVQVRDCVEQGGASAYQLQDHLGSPRVFVDSSGSIGAHCEYDAYGVLSSGGDACAYTGHVPDSETGLYRTPTRFYGAEAGRFASVDPVPESWTPYNYAGNQPTGSIDPSGSVVLNITENARGRFLPNPEGIVLHASSRIVGGFLDQATMKEALSLDNFLAIRSEDFFRSRVSGAGTIQREAVSIVFPDPVNVSNIRYLSINMHGDKNGAIYPFIDDRALSQHSLINDLIYRLHSSNPRFSNGERTILENLWHISCQTCYGAVTARDMARILSESIGDSFNPDPQLSVSGSPYSVSSGWTGSSVVARRSGSWFDWIRSVWRGPSYSRLELARGNIPRRALIDGDYLRFPVQYPRISLTPELPRSNPEPNFESTDL